MAVFKHIDFQVPGWGELQAGPHERLSYRGQVMADSPLMFLRLGESAGTTAYDETGQHHATVDGALTWGTEGALSLDGDTAVHSSGTGGLFINETGWLPIGSAARTIELWFKPSLDSVEYRGINYGVNQPGRRLNVIYLADEVSITVSNCRYGVVGLDLVDQWQHLTLVFPNGATRCDEFLFYLNGQAVVASVLAGNGATLIDTADTGLMINQIVSGVWNHGGFDEVTIYGSALSAERIQSHYQAGVALEVA